MTVTCFVVFIAVLRFDFRFPWFVVLRCLSAGVAWLGRFLGGGRLLGRFLLTFEELLVPTFSLSSSNALLMYVVSITMTWLCIVLSAYCSMM